MSITIKRPDLFSKQDIQSYTAGALSSRSLKLDIRQNVPLEIPDGRNLRLNLVGFNYSGKAQFIVEIKKSGKASKDTKRIRRIKELVDVPVYVITGTVNQRDVINEIKSKHKQ